MKTKQLGNTKLKVSEMGLGCMGMSEFYGHANQDEAIATLRHALSLGVNFFDTADIYGMGANEELLAKTFKQDWNKIILATKTGIIRDPNTFRVTGLNGRADYIKNACDASLKRLGLDVIDLYYLHRIDPNVPIEETLGAMVDLITVGKVRYIGLSEVNATTLRKAHQIYPITALQSEYSLWSRGAEAEIIPLCEELNISFVAYSPLGRGFLTHKLHSLDNLEKADYRRSNPRFDEKNFQKNYDLVEKLTNLAQNKKCSAAQLALAWTLAKSPRVIPIPGTKKRHYLEENISAAAIELNREDIAELDNLFKSDGIAGERYSAESMQYLNN